MRSALAALGLGLFGLALFARNWAGWADPLVDFGRELYVPWQLLEGHALYRDFAYLDGPFAPHWNALVFAVSGRSVRALELSNLAVIAVAASCAFALLQRLSDRVTACAGVALFLAVFAFNPIGAGDNMTWVAPYSHGITHGVALSLLALWLFARFLERERPVQLAAAGLALGAVGLTKPEVFAAAALALGVGVIAWLWQSRLPSGGRLARAALFGAAVLAPPALACLALLTTMPAGVAFGGVLGGWPHLFETPVAALHFYRWVMGVDDVAGNVTQMITWSALWLAALAPAWVAARAVGRRESLPIALAAAPPLALAALAWLVFTQVSWGDAFRPLAAFLVLCVGHAAYRLARAAGRDAARLATLRLCLALFALALLGKVLLRPVLVGYAFALAAPGALVLVLALVHDVPAAIARRGGEPRLFRPSALVLLALVALGCWWQTEVLRPAETIDVGSGPDRIRSAPDQRAWIAAKLVGWVDAHLPREATLVVLPEGVSVNYLTRRTNPTRHLNFLPPELAIFGEDAILADLRAHPPDFVALVQRDTLEYGLPLFGTDYGKHLMRWVRREYERVALIGAAPLRCAGQRTCPEGFEVLRRRGREAAR